MNQARIKKLQQQIKTPLLVVKKENLFYFTGQHFIDGYLLVTKNKVVFFGNGLEQIKNVDSDFISAIHKYVKSGQTLAIEDCITVSEWEYLKKKLKGVKVVSASGVVENLRAIKSSSELADLAEVHKITATVFSTIKTQLQKKQWTEEGLASYIKVWGLELGADEVSFDPIVACGANAAIPHHRPGPEILKKGQSIVLDFGFKFNGYCSDFTRTVFLGSAPVKLRDAYNEVEKAHNLAFDFASTGKTGGEVDEVARESLAKAKLDKDFIHSLGHGTGLEVHEMPSVSPRSDSVLENGMVFSIEPGVYFPKLGGIRIEDLVYMEKGKPQYFVKVPTDLKSNII